MNSISPPWQDFIAKVYIPQLNAFKGWVRDKFLPPMRDEILETEAEELVADYYGERFMSNMSLFNSGSIAISAEEIAQNYYIGISELKQGLLNLFAVGLYHLFEQQLLRLYRQDLLDKSCSRVVEHLIRKIHKSKNENKLLKELLSPRIVESVLLDKGIIVSHTPAWPIISELRLLANSIKHADGESCERLKRSCPELFANPILRDISSVFSGTQTQFPVLQPLTGESIFVTDEVLTRYIDAIIEFWEFILDPDESCHA